MISLHKDITHERMSITCAWRVQVITSGCATYEPWASALGGIIGGLAVIPSSLFILHVLKVDDPVDAVTVCFSSSSHGLSMREALACGDWLSSSMDNL